MRSRSALLLSSVLILSSSFSSAATLSELVNTGLQNSPKVKKAEASVDEAGGKKLETYSAFLPAVSLTGSYLLGKRYLLTDVALGGSPVPVSIPQILPTTTLQANVSWNLFEGGAGVFRTRAAKYGQDSAESDLSWTRFQTKKDIQLLFLKALAARSLVRVAESNLATLKDHLKEVQQFKKAGISTNFDVLRVEVQVSEAESEIENSRDTFDALRGRLAEAIGSEAEVEINGDLRPLPEDILTQPVRTVGSRDDLIALQNKEESIHNLVRSSQGHWLPKVSLFGSYIYYNNLSDGFDDWAKLREGYQYGVNFAWNIFDGGGAMAKVKQIAAQDQQLKESVRAATLHQRQDVPFWKKKFDYYRRVYKSRQNDIEKAKESVRLAREGRKVGSRTNTDLLDAESELFRAQAGYVNALAGSMEAVINYELSTGQEYLTDSMIQ